MEILVQMLHNLESLLHEENVGNIERVQNHYVLGTLPLLVSL
jgi:hypothetical protein